MSDFDVSMRLNRPEGRLPPEDRKPFEWSKVMTGIQICGALLTIPVGAAGVYAAYRSNFSVEVTCQALRTTIISTLEKNVDPDTKRALARRDVAEFERTCATIDPDAKGVFASMMAPKVGTPGAPAAIVAAPEPAAKDLAKPVIKANAAHDPITEAIEREAARVPAQVKAPASVATPLTTPTVKQTAAPVPASKPTDAKPAVVERTSVERTAVAPKGDKPALDKQALGEPPAPLGSRLGAPAEAAANPQAGPKPVPAVTPRTASLPETEPVKAPDTTSSSPMGPLPPNVPPPLETANVPAVTPTFSPAPYSPPVEAARAEPAREPAKRSGVIPFVSDLFGGAPPRPPGEISRDVENGPAN